MRAEQLFAVVKAKWPQQIDIAGSELVGSRGFFSPELNRLEEEIDAKKTNDPDVVQAALWPFHQALWRLARTQFQLGVTTIPTSAVNLNDFIHYLKDGLEHASWAEERDAFRRDNPELYADAPGAG